MKNKEILKWRLSKLPSSEEVLSLVKDGVITKEEAREILFTTSSEGERDEDSLKAEIKFLRELVAKLSNNQQTRIIEVIKEVEKPYYRWDWHQPYMYYCSGTSGQTYALGAQATGATALTASAESFPINAGLASTGSRDFTNIKTF